jgi:hypothetical protein
MNDGAIKEGDGTISINDVIRREVGFRERSLDGCLMCVQKYGALGAVPVVHCDGHNKSVSIIL